MQRKALVWDERARRRGRVSREGVKESIERKEESGNREGGRKDRNIKARKGVGVPWKSEKERKGVE